MIVYKITWEDRYGTYTKWMGTLKDVSAQKAAIRRKATKRPYDQIEITASCQMDIPTGKADLLGWLNQFVR